MCILFYLKYTTLYTILVVSTRCCGKSSTRAPSTCRIGWCPASQKSWNNSVMLNISHRFESFLFFCFCSRLFSFFAFRVDRILLLLWWEREETRVVLRKTWFIQHAMGYLFHLLQSYCHCCCTLWYLFTQNTHLPMRCVCTCDEHFSTRINSNDEYHYILFMYGRYCCYEYLFSYFPSSRLYVCVTIGKKYFECNQIFEETKISIMWSRRRRRGIAQ